MAVGVGSGHAGHRSWTCPPAGSRQVSVDLPRHPPRPPRARPPRRGQHRHRMERRPDAPKPARQPNRATGGCHRPGRFPYLPPVCSCRWTETRRRRVASRRGQSRMRTLDSSTIQSRPSSSSGRDRRNRLPTSRTWSRVWLLRRNTTIPGYSRGGYVRMSAKSVASVTMARRSRTHADATLGSVAPPSLWSRTVDASCPTSPNRFASSAGRFSSSLKRMWVIQRANDSTRSLARSAA